MDIKPDFLFETSWEVCNKVGGIYTVITSKMPTFYQKYGDNMAFIGPDLLKDNTTKHPLFVEDKKRYIEWRKNAETEGLRIRIGHWEVAHKPLAILVDFSDFISQKDMIFTKFWEKYKLDSLTDDWGYIESALFGYAAGKVIESFTKHNLKGKQVVAQFHEWMTGTGVLYLEANAPFIGTIFTTHATVLGRSIAGNGLPLYNALGAYEPEIKAKELNIACKHSLEKNAAQIADVFTTVSKVTALECNHFLNNVPDFITPNGFALEHLEPITPQTIKTARQKLCDVTNALTGTICDENTTFIATSGRYEFKNKGIDIFIDALANLNFNNKLKNRIVGFILVPAQQYGPNKELLENLVNNTSIVPHDSICTHALNPNAFDPVIDKCKQRSLLNYPGQMVNIIFVPTYLNGDDGIFNMEYYHLLSGFDLTAFPSYYEPWGYTPLESLALDVPTITTSLSGFGQWMASFGDDILNGLKVVNRTENNYHDVVAAVENSFLAIANASSQTKNISKQKAHELSEKTVWSLFSQYYFDAHTKAITLSSKRTTTNINLSTTKKMEKLAISNEPVWKKMIIHSDLPDSLKILEEISMNIWWSWNYQAVEMFEYIAPELWEKCDKNPVALLKKVSSDRFTELEKDNSFMQKLQNVYAAFKKYINEPAKTNFPKIAYFSMEYGLTDNIKIYSGGLGLLAGDYLKEASDTNTPIVAVGFLYKYGYFTQHLTVSGEQQANLVPQKFADLPIVPILDEFKHPQTIQLSLPGRYVKARIWRVDVGRVPLYLLDTDFVENNDEDRTITNQLYGGDWENRLKQELFLGIGGIRVLKTLGINPDIYHCNEGHAAFINIERLSNLVQHENLTFDEALEVVRASSLFTTHTPVPAGHDAFDENLIRTYLRHMPERLKIDWNDFLNLGRGNLNSNEKFSMSVLAARTSSQMNGVSRLHGEVSRDMFQYMWKGYTSNELYIDYVTNGVHYPTWTAKEWRKLYESKFGEGFLNDLSNPKYWEKIHQVPDSDVWEIRNTLRKKLIDYIKDRFQMNFVQRHENPRQIIEILNTINENTLTIGFARRFATYKRAHLIFSDINRLQRIVNNPNRPVQLLFAGKAHPHDKAGQDLIKHIVEISRRPEFAGKILFLENYDIELAKRLVKGVDIWLNNPTRPLEASGTSGQKAELNGVLNFSVLDGWWVEGYKEKAGWAISEKITYQNDDFQNELDASIIYSTIENEIVPLFYNRDKNNLPVEWVQYVKRSIAGIAPHFTTKRMIDDYTNKYYISQYKRSKYFADNNFKAAIDMAAWKSKVATAWNNIEVVSIDFPNTLKNTYTMGQNYHGEVVIDTKGLDHNDIGVELVFAANNCTRIIDSKELKLAKAVESVAFFEIDFELKKPGSYDYGLRIFPKHKDLPHRQDFPFLKWL